MSLADRSLQIRTELGSELSVTNVNAVPKLQKIVLNVGLGSMRQTPKIMETVSDDLARVTGQRPAPRRARKAIAGFKLRAGEPIGVALTLRGRRMYDFLERLIRTSLPRIRDFRGLPLEGFDGSGNYTFGIREHTVFPEIEHDRVTQFYGLGITIVTTATRDADAERLLRRLGLPLVARSMPNVVKA